MLKYTHYGVILSQAIECVSIGSIPTIEICFTVLKLVLILKTAKEVLMKKDIIKFLLGIKKVGTFVIYIASLLPGWEPLSLTSLVNQKTTCRWFFFYFLNKIIISMKIHANQWCNLTIKVK